MDEQELIARLTEGEAGSAQIAKYLEALRERRRQLAKDPSAKSARELRRVDRLLQALSQQQAISEFVEEQIRTVLRRHGVIPGN